MVFISTMSAPLASSWDVMSCSFSAGTVSYTHLAAFAAGNKEDAFYTIGLDACGGVSSTVVLSLIHI